MILDRMVLKVVILFGLNLLLLMCGMMIMLGVRDCVMVLILFIKGIVGFMKKLFFWLKLNIFLKIVFFIGCKLVRDLLFILILL